MKNWKIGTRITAGFMVITLIAALLGTFAYIQAVNTQKSETVLADNSLPSLAILGNLETRTTLTLNMLGRHVHSHKPAEKVELEQQIQELKDLNTRDLNAYRLKAGRLCCD